MNLPSKEYLEACFSYDASTGALVWKKRPEDHFGSPSSAAQWNGKMAGKLAGSKDRLGRLYVTMGGPSALAHRIVWKIAYGVDPNVIDHIDGNPSNNRLENLRSVTQAVNCRNMRPQDGTRSGHMGVDWHRVAKKWRASLRVDGHNKHLGLFERIEDAVSARQQAQSEYDYHPNHGSKPAPGTRYEAGPHGLRPVRGDAR